MRNEGAPKGSHLGVLHSSAVPPIERDLAERELTEEERALRNSRPRTRRWKALDKLDREVDNAMQRQADATARLHEAEQALTHAPADDARSLADWLAGGQRGERPAATLYERERDRDAARLLVEAATVEIDRALERRLRHVEKNRKKMLGDARRDIGQARAEIMSQVEKLPALRQALADARAMLLWAAAYPEHLESFGFETAAALGLRKPINDAFGTDARIEYQTLVRTLAADAEALATGFSDEQKRQLGADVPRDPLKDAMWWDDPNDKDLSAWKREQLERARNLAEWSMNPDRIAAEIREDRP